MEHYRYLINVCFYRKETAKQQQQKTTGKPSENVFLLISFFFFLINLVLEINKNKTLQKEEGRFSRLIF